MTCVGAILARNEADRYLAATIASMQGRCDRILLLDDGSTDETVAVATEMGCAVRQRSGDPMWGQEASARAELWAWGAEAAGDGWLYIADADHELVAPPDVWASMCTAHHVTAWAMSLYDCWDSPQQHRADGYWQGYQRPRTWLFRPGVCPEPQWESRGIHVGHAPANFPLIPGLAPATVWIRHLGWMRQGDRDAKLDRYLAVSDQLTPDELAHLQTVAHDPAPRPDAGCPS